ncbi:tetraspanin-14 isoform X2 [Bicyclus anynana]|nr:tetraspanin-14 isoform X2 [Bicyclus anynana]XP_052737513.1 tetraspanin-14 isoform X2 [Bicyclus anynana]
MKFNKTETEYNMKSVKFLLLTITSMFIIIAALMIVLGFSVYSHYHTFSFFYESAQSGRLFTPSLLCILLGMFLLIVTMFGFFGSLKQSTCLVNLYALILAIMLILKLVVIILAFTLDSSTIHGMMYIPAWDYAADPEIEMEMDRLQISLNCCGSDSVFDYIDVPFTSNHSTTIVSTNIVGPPMDVVVPESCCVSPGGEFCHRHRERGCRTALVNLFSQNATVIGVMGVSVMFIQLLGIIFSLLLARCIRKVKSERGLMSWRIKEQMIMAREDAKKQDDNKSVDDSVYIPPHESSTA